MTPGRAMLSTTMADSNPKATYLVRLLVLLQENPRPDQVRALLDRAQRVGVKPNGLYLSALRLHPRDLPLPPDPRLVLEVPAALRRRYGAAASGELRPEVPLASPGRTGAPSPRHRRRCCTARRRPHGR